VTKNWLHNKICPTKRALDAGDSVAFSSIFLASSFFCSQTESTPAPAPVTPTVSPFVKEIVMPLTNYALDKFISQHLSQLTQYNAPEVSSRYPQRKSWVSHFSLNSIFTATVSKEARTFSFFFLRRAEAAFAEYEYACEALNAFTTGRSKSPSLYFKALHHFEMVVSMMWQAYMLAMKISGQKLYEANDGSEYERLNWVYNKSRHFEPAELSEENIHVIWLTNNGIQSEKYGVTYLEIESFLIEIGNTADKLSKAGQ
jgi:hypothetical protein